LKNRITAATFDAWQALTAVPGQPLASGKVRFRHAVPILGPCLLLLVLGAWRVGVLDRHIDKGRKDGAAWVALDAEVASLGVQYSEMEARDLKMKSDLVARTLFVGQGDIDAAMDKVRHQARANGWDADFQPVDWGSAAQAQGSMVSRLYARGALRPVRGNSRQWASLLVLLEQFSASDKQIGLTRLVVRADEEGRYFVEVTLALTCRPNDEKAFQ
jgi:hypothetical protein